MLSRRAPMEEFIARYWRLNRSAVSADTDRLIDGLRAEVPEGVVLETPSGAAVLDWEVPPRWEVRKAQLRTLGGAVLADFADNPLVLWTHSISFSGRVSREELLADHVVSDPDRPDEVLYRYEAGYRYRSPGSDEWGFSLPHRLVAGMTDAEYQVEIDADLDNAGTLKVFDAFLPGRLSDTVFFMAHTCHPAQVADGLANVAVLIQLYRHLSRLAERQYSYRFLFGPEYFGAAAWLAGAPADQVAALRWGLYCDMLSAHEPFGWQDSFAGDSRMDAVLASVVPTHSATFHHRAYRRLWGNDEMFFNGPGYRIPMAAVGRGHSGASPREYHYDSDNLEAMDGYHLVEALWILQRIVEVFETDRLPVRDFSGPPYQSRHGLYADASSCPGGYGLREAVPILMDGRKSLMDIAAELEVDFFAVRELARCMQGAGLVELEPLAAGGA
jgi:aminopeptidase-like protein